MLNYYRHLFLSLIVSRFILRMNYVIYKQKFVSGLNNRKGVTYNVTYDPTAAVIKTKSTRVAVLREEGNPFLFND